MPQSLALVLVHIIFSTKKPNGILAVDRAPIRGISFDERYVWD